MMDYSIRQATMEDLPSLEALIALSVRGLSTKDYSSVQIEAALRGAFGVDTDLIKDGTYFIAEAKRDLIGCGGWSKRKTFFGGDKYAIRDSGELDPQYDSAKIRAFFVHPGWARQGIGKAILTRCEAKAREQGFRSLELIATLPGLKFYSALGFEGSEQLNYELTPDLTIRFVPMKKVLA
jgi:N-acetylglutamate synthase-like GNAT family acetyltransferase